MSAVTIWRSCPLVYRLAAHGSSEPDSLRITPNELPSFLPWALLAGKRRCEVGLRALRQYVDDPCLVIAIAAPAGGLGCFLAALGARFLP